MMYEILNTRFERKFSLILSRTLKTLDVRLTQLLRSQRDITTLQLLTI